MSKVRKQANAKYIENKKSVKKTLKMNSWHKKIDVYLFG